MSFAHNHTYEITGKGDGIGMKTKMRTKMKTKMKTLVCLLLCVMILPAFSVRDIGHGTGIDNIDVRPVLEGNFLVSVSTEDLTHNIQFIAVYFTAQIVKCYLLH